MARINKEKLSYEIKEVIGSISPTSDHNTWCKAVLNTICNGEEMIDIRRMELAKQIAGKGVSLTKSEADSLVDLLLDQGYGSYESIKKAMDEKEKLFKGGN